jgi:hypothetical protein
MWKKPENPLGAKGLCTQVGMNGKLGLGTQSSSKAFSCRCLASEEDSPVCYGVLHAWGKIVLEYMFYILAGRL